MVKDTTSDLNREDTFSVLSWNINLGTPSQQAPDGVDREENLNHMLDIIEVNDPDFICLQEMPMPSFTDNLSNYYVSGQPVPSHSGYSTVFVRKGPIAEQPIQLENQLNLQPAAGISLNIGQQFLIIFSMHLPPYKENAEHRYGFLKSLLSQLSADQPLLLVGDMNMREMETSSITDLGVNDAYQVWDDPNKKQHYATWDTTINHFYPTGHQFRARFDRIFYRNLVLHDYQLIGNLPQAPNNYYLSDHFGILAEFGF